MKTVQELRCILHEIKEKQETIRCLNRALIEIDKINKVDNKNYISYISACSTIKSIASRLGNEVKDLDDTIIV